MRIADIYRPRLLTCRPDDSLVTVAQKMTTEQVGALAVVDGDDVVGVISERDIARAAAEDHDLSATTAARHMSEYLEVANLNDDHHDIARLMLNSGIRHLPVVRGNRLIGMVSIRDLLAVETWAA